MTIRIASALSQLPGDDVATALIESIQQQLDGAAADLGCLFYAPPHAARAGALARQISERLQLPHLIGCQGVSIVGRREEIESGPAASLWVASLGSASVETFALQFERSPDGGVISGWPASDWPEDSAMLLLGEPFSFPADVLLERLHEDRPETTVAGGMASGGQSPGTISLLHNQQVLSGGAVVARLSGPVRLRTVVSQGCRPVGQPLVITKADRNLILELGGRPALLQLQELFESLPNREKQLAQQGLHVGRVINEYQERFEAGDFSIRNVVGIDPDAGAVAAGDYFRPGQTVQFHLRDQESADRELNELLAGAATAGGGSAAGGLLFTCNGRGSQMFDIEHHDAAAVDRYFPDLPLAGFFAQGEIGPIGGRSFMHGFTASLALLEDAAE